MSSNGEAEAGPDRVGKVTPSSTGPGPAKKSRLELEFQLPESLDDAVVQLPSGSGAAGPQAALPADEARRQLGTLQLGSGDYPSSPRQTDTAEGVLASGAAGLAPAALAAPVKKGKAAAGEAATAGDQGVGAGPSGGAGKPATAEAAAAANQGAAATTAAVPALTAVAAAGPGAGAGPALSGAGGGGGGRGGGGGAAALHREASLEPAPSDPGVLVSVDVAAGSST